MNCKEYWIDFYKRNPPKTYKFSIDEDLGIEWADAGPWRSVNICSFGNSLAELIENCSLSEVDQDGGELNTFDLEDSPYYNEALEALKHLVED